MSVYTFNTIDGNAEGQYKDKGSKFLAFAYPVRTEADVKQRLEQLRKKYFDATHHCYAYVLGADKARFRAVDDGEPHHSAGDPILNQIRSHHLTDVLVVVVRYYGGTKLGVSGLIQAYRAAAESALQHALIITVEVKQTITIHFDYEHTAEVMRLVHDFNLEVMARDYGAACVLTVRVASARASALNERLAVLCALHPAIEFKDIQTG